MVEFKKKVDLPDGDSPRVVLNPEGTVELHDLPLQCSGQRVATHFCDVMPDLPLPIPDISEAMRMNDYKALPVQLREKKEVGIGYTMQVLMLERGESQYILLKHFHMVKPILIETAKSDLCHGELLVISNDQCPDRLRSQRVFQHMLESIGGNGVQYLYASLEDKVTSKRKVTDTNPRADQKFHKKDSRDLSRIAEGYSCRRSKDAPKANNRGQVNEWADIKVNHPESVLFGWCEGKVKEYLKCLIMGRQTCTRIDWWPFTLKSFKPWFLDMVLSKMLKTHTHKMDYGGLVLPSLGRVVVPRPVE